MKKESPIGHWPSKCLCKNVGTEGMKGPQDMAMPNVLEEEPGGQARRMKGSWADVRLEGEGRPHWPLGGTVALMQNEMGAHCRDEQENDLSDPRF